MSRYYSMKTQKFDFFFKKFEIYDIQFCPYPEKRSHLSFVNISPSLVIDTSMGRSSKVATSYSMESKKIELFFKKSSKLNFDLAMLKSWNHIVIDASMERSSWVLQHGNLKIWFFSSKKFKIEFWLVFCLMLKSWNHIVANWYINGKVIISSYYNMASWQPKCFFFFSKKVWNWFLSFILTEKKKSWNLLSFLDISPTLVANWYINGKFFMSSYCNMKTEKFEFFSNKFEIEFGLVFWLVLNSWNHLGFINIRPALLVIDTSMGRSSLVLQHENPKIWISFHKIKVAKGLKNSSVGRHLPRLYMGVA